MIVYLATFLISASVAAALTPASRVLSIRLGALDIPDNRKVHRTPMPRLGGMAIVIAFLAPVIGLAATGSPHAAELSERELQVVALVVGGFVIAALGALDDIRGLRARIKLVVQVAVAVFAWLLGFRFENIGLPLVGVAQLPVWLDFLLSVLWIAGVTNAMNLIDGLDGLAAGVTFFVASTNLVLSLRSGNELGALFAAALAGSVIGFLLFNWNRAVVFMGDTGSMFLGYILATTSIMTSQKVSTAVAMVVPIAALGVPVIDTLLSIVRRFLEKRSIFSPDKDHLHHRLLSAGFTKRKAVLAIYALSIVFAISAIALTAARNLETAVAMGILAVVVVGIVRFFGFFNLSAAVRGALQRSPLAERLRPRIPHFTARVMRESESADEIWGHLATLFRECGIAELYWQTVGITPPDERRELLMAPDEYHKARKKGFYKAGVSVPIDSESYIEIQIIYPIEIGKVSPVADAMLKMASDAAGAAISRLDQEGKWEGHASRAAPPDPEPSAVQFETSEATCTPGEVERRNPALDEVWETFKSNCRDMGFVGVGWKTLGINPPDLRKVSFEQGSDSERGVLKKSVPISSTAFLEIFLIYPGKTGRKTPLDVRTKAKEVSAKAGRSIRGLYKHLSNKS